MRLLGAFSARLLTLFVMRKFPTSSSSAPRTAGIVAMLKRVLRLTIKRRAPVAVCPRRTSFLLCGKGRSLTKAVARAARLSPCCGLSCDAVALHYGQATKRRKGAPRDAGRRAGGCAACEPEGKRGPPWPIATLRTRAPRCRRFPTSWSACSSSPWTRPKRRSRGRTSFLHTLVVKDNLFIESHPGDSARSASEAAEKNVRGARGGRLLRLLLRRLP